MKKNSTKKTKKLPVLTYLCYLLVVSILFTGVTFSRYSTATSGDLSAGISPFVISYEIDNVSSNTYTNANFWLNSGTRQGTPRTIRFTLRNYEEGADGSVLRMSDVDLQATLRLYLPAEFADNLVLQLTDGTRAVTPQYILGNMIYQVNKPTTETGYYTYAEPFDYRMYAENGTETLNTAYFRDYIAVNDGMNDEQLTMQGGFTSSEEGGVTSLEGTVTATGQTSRTTISITASNSVTQYSLGFGRNESGNSSNIYPQLFLDLEKQVPFYTVDIVLGGDAFSFSANEPAEKQFVLYLTLAENIPSADYNRYWKSEDDPQSDDSGAVNGDTWDYTDFLKPTAGGLYDFNGATVTGYHFDADAQTVSADHTSLNDTTQVRIQKTFERDAQTGNYTGNSILSFHHVAPISESVVNYVHPISEFYNGDRTEVTPDQLESYTMEQYHDLFGVCSNLADVSSGSSEYYRISFAGLSDFPLRSSAAREQDDLTITYSLSKSYLTQVNVVFTQTSLSGGVA